MSVEETRWRATALAGLAFLGGTMGAGLPVALAGRLRWMFTGIHVAAGWAAALVALAGALALVIGQISEVLETATYRAVAVPLPWCLGGPLLRRMLDREAFREWTPGQQRTLLTILSHGGLGNAFGGEDLYALSARSGIRPRLALLPNAERVSEGDATEHLVSPGDGPRPNLELLDGGAARDESSHPSPVPRSSPACTTWRRRVFGRWLNNVIEIRRGELDEYRRQWQEGEDGMDVVFGIAARRDGGALEAKYATEIGAYHLYGASRAALMLGTLLGFAYGARVLLLGSTRPLIPLIVAGLMLVLINVAWMLLVTYPSRRRRWQKALRIKGNQLSALLLEPEPRATLTVMSANAAADVQQARLWDDAATGYSEAVE